MQQEETTGESVSYLQVAKALRDEIRNGAYADSGTFPSLTKIMNRFGVSRPSAVRSVAELKRLGLVGARKGAGTFVLAKSRTIGLALPGTADSDFFAAVMDGLIYNCRKYGFDMIAGDVFAVDHDRRDRQAERLAHHFAAKNVAGVVMQPVGFSENADRINGIISDILDKADIPVVLIDYDIVPSPCCLLRPLCADSVHVRFAGVDSEVRRSRGRPANIIVAEPYDDKKIAAALEELRPDAIVCSNDIAAGMLAKTLRRLKVRVPRDVMLAGFDDVEAAAKMKPPLTSMRQPCFELASMAFRTLVERMANPGLPPRKLLLDTTLVVRESTCRGA